MGTIGSLVKSKSILSIKKLPEDFSVFDLLDELLLIQKIETGIQQSD